MLDPDFVVLNIDIKNATVNTALIGPANMYDLITVLNKIKNGFGFYCFVTSFNLAVVFLD